MAEKTYNEETDEWMASVGYTLNLRTKNDSVRSYTPSKLEGNEHAPTIVIYNTVDGRYCELIGTDLKLFCQIKSGQLAYKHKDIKKWIDVITHYTKVCSMYPPW